MLSLTRRQYKQAANIDMYIYLLGLLALGGWFGFMML